MLKQPKVLGIVKTQADTVSILCNEFMYEFVMREAFAFCSEG